MTNTPSTSPDNGPLVADRGPLPTGAKIKVPQQRAVPAASGATDVAVSTTPAATAAVPRRPAVWSHQAGADAQFALVGFDLIALTITWLVTGNRALGLVLLVGAWLAARVAVRAYRPRLQLAALDDVPRLLKAGCLSLGVLVGTRLIFFDGRGIALRSVVQIGVAIALSFLATAIAFALLRAYRRRRAAALRATLVVGSSAVGAALEEALRVHPEFGLRPVGIFGRAPGSEGGLSHDPESDMAHDLASLTRAIAAVDASVVVLAHQDSEDVQGDSIITVHQSGAELFVVPIVFELYHDGPDVDRVRGIPMIRLRRDPTHRPTWWVKRVCDVLIAAIVLALVSPILAVAAIAILVDSGRPLLFRQIRIGLDGRPFELLKLRSMRPATPGEGDTTWNIAADPRLTRLGKVLRRTSIDELPQLWNIIRGQMSLVGPRPERPAFVERFTLEHERYWARHRVPVGLTGLAQVNGLRGDTSIRERARYDNYYIANWSLWLDVKVLLLTLREVVGARGR